MLFEQSSSYYQSRNESKMSIDSTNDGRIKLLPIETKISLQSGLVLCKSCLWCASQISRRGSVNECPVCGALNVQLMPIHEVYNNDDTKTPIGRLPLIGNI
jgi:hypothetical protein